MYLQNFFLFFYFFIFFFFNPLTVENLENSSYTYWPCITNISTDYNAFFRWKLVQNFYLEHFCNNDRCTTTESVSRICYSAFGVCTVTFTTNRPKFTGKLSSYSSKYISIAQTHNSRTWKWLHSLACRVQIWSRVRTQDTRVGKSGLVIYLF